MSRGKRYGHQKYTDGGKPAATGRGGFATGSEEDDLSIEYPSSDGEPMAESKLQYTPLTDTVSALENYFIDRNDVFIAGDLLVYYRMNDNQTRVAPDVFVVFGAAGNHPRDSWLVWREGKTPDFVMEDSVAQHLGTGRRGRSGKYTPAWM